MDKNDEMEKYKDKINLIYKTAEKIIIYYLEKIL